MRTPVKSEERPAPGFMLTKFQGRKEKGRKGEDSKIFQRERGIKKKCVPMPRIRWDSGFSSAALDYLPAKR